MNLETRIKKLEEVMEQVENISVRRNKKPLKVLPSST